MSAHQAGQDRKVEQPIVLKAKVQKPSAHSVAPKRSISGQTIGPLTHKTTTATNAPAPHGAQASLKPYSGRRNLLATPPSDVKLPPIPRPWANTQYVDKRPSSRATPGQNT